MIKAGIIGCGKIADQHAEGMRFHPGCELSGVCDSEELMARQLCERFNAKAYYSEVDVFLESARPDVVHITTPTQSHFALGKKCLSAGCHVYMEKPFTLTAGEAEDLIELAIKKNVKITVGHNVQFTHASRRMRAMVKDGYLGGMPIHMESYYCYDLRDPSYAKALLGDSNHWVRKMPGKLLQNIINHGIAKIAEFLPGDDPAVIAHGFTSPLLRSIGEKEILDELRVIIREGDTTAYFTFSSQMNPILHQFRLYGAKNSLVVDDDNQTLIKIRGGKYKSYLDHFIPPINYARQYLANAKYNITKFVQSDFHMNGGMNYLINAFYESIEHDSPPPIPYREIILTTRIMDIIFTQINNGASSLRGSSHGE